jgi:hypothetical protein
METKPLERMRIVTTQQDEKYVEALLDKTIARGLICQDCGSTRVIVEAYIKAKLEILNESTVAVITGVNSEVAYVNKIVECAICRSKKVSAISI